MTPSKQNTFCSYPFTDLAMKQFGGNKLEAVWPCCMMGNRTKSSAEHVVNKLGIQNLSQLTPDEIFNHPRMQELRKNSLSGIRDSACAICWEQEDNNLVSFRQNSPSITEDQIEKPSLRTVDITTSNVCNLRCRMCAPVTSNSLMIDQKYFREHGLDEDYRLVSGNWSSNSDPIMITDSVQWDWLMNNSDKITYIKASGGEPFYDNKVIKLLDRYIETGNAKNTRLAFHTNGTVIDDQLIEKLNQFQGNEHTFSIDGFGTAYDYIRYPAKFNEVDAILKNYVAKSTTLKHFHLSIVVSSLNLLSIVDYINWARSFTKPGEFHVYVHFAEIYPTFRGTHISRLPVSLLNVARQRLKDFSDNDNEIYNLKTMIDNAIVNNEENLDLMLREIKPFDQSRNQSYHDFLDPLIIEWLDNDRN